MTARRRPACDDVSTGTDMRTGNVPTQLLILALLALVLHGCVTRPEGGGVGGPVAWTRVPGWAADRHGEAWPAFLASCSQLARGSDDWRGICADALALGQADDDTARVFFESRLRPHPVWSEEGGREGLITGYYEPLLDGNLQRTGEYRYPVYRRPDDLLIIDFGEMYEELKGLRLRGRLDGGRRVVPYFSRTQIENGDNPLKGHEIAWVRDPIGLFFLHIQGSGRIRLPDGRMLAVGYSDQNGHPYLAIGRQLIREGYFKPEEMSMQAIRAWLRDNPDRAEALLLANPSYVFFESREATGDGPVGTLGVPLLPERSVAVDRRFITLGVPLWLDTVLPPAADEDKPPVYRRLVVAQDTGGAIRGPVRADLFWGRGERAEDYAGRMRQPGKLYVLLPAVQPKTVPVTLTAGVGGQAPR